LKPEDDAYDARVEGHRGLNVRVFPSGHKSFVYRSGQDRKMSRLTLKAQSLAEATAEWADLKRRKFQAGEDIASTIKKSKAEAQKKRVKARSEPTIEVLAGRYIAEYARPKKRSWLQDEQRLNRLVIPLWGKMKAADITRADVQALVKELAINTPTLANRVLALVRKMFSFAVDVGALSVHPCLRMSAPAAEQPRLRVLDEKEMRFLWRCTSGGVWKRIVPDSIASILRLQLLTGCRHKEVRGARRGEFDMGKMEWLIPRERVKNNRDHLVPLTPLMIGCLGDQKVGKRNEVLFPWPGEEGHVRADTLDRAMREACRRVKRIGIPAFRPHDLRRTTETGMARLGVSLELRNRVMNHKDMSVSGLRYNTHDYIPEKRAALTLWEREVRRILGLSEPSDLA